jgi:DNA-binding NarL/FixJ family response regulator
MATRIVLADDHRVLRESLAVQLQQTGDYEVLGQASDGAEAVRLARELCPDVVVLDISMPGTDGIDAAREIVRRDPAVRVLALSMYADTPRVVDMFGAGATGYVLKSCQFDELRRAIESVAAGERYFDRAIDPRVADWCREKGGGRTGMPMALSPRERQVLKMVASGATTKEIAAQLHLSPKTVEMHRGRIMARLGIRSIAALTKYAIREGLTDVHS